MNDHLQEEGWVVCRVFRKKMPAVRRMNEHESCSWYDDHVSFMPEQLDTPKRSLIPHPDYLGYHNPLAAVYPCKQEVEYYNNFHFHLPHPDPYLQLPQLESPKLQSSNTTTGNASCTSISLYGINNNSVEVNLANQLNASPFSQEHQLHPAPTNLHGQLNQNMSSLMCSGSTCTDNQDWRVLDKLVAAQLSHDLQDVSKEAHKYSPAANGYQVMDQRSLYMVQSEKTQATETDYASTCTSSCQIELW